MGRISGVPEVKRSKNGDTDVLVFPVHFSDGGTATVQWMPGTGEDSNPQMGDRVSVEYFGGILIATTCKTPFDPKIKTGERNLFSRDPHGKMVAHIYLYDTGEILSESYTGDSIINQKPDGEILIYTRKGQALVRLTPDGYIRTEAKNGAKTTANTLHYIGNNATDLCTVLIEIIDLIKGLITVGSPALHTVRLDYQGELENYKAVIKSLFTEDA
jgi:hypothetical protein